MLRALCAPQATVPAVHPSLTTSVPSQDTPPCSTHELQGQLSLLWWGQKAVVGTIQAAPWQIVQHSMGSWRWPLLPGSSWRQQVQGRVFSQHLLPFLSYGWINRAKNLHIVSIPAHKQSELVPVVCRHEAGRLLCITCAMTCLTPWLLASCLFDHLPMVTKHIVTFCYFYKCF